MAVAAKIRNKLALLDGSHTLLLRLPGAVASFTFDDFPASAYTVAGSMIEQAGGRATYFASASFMGKTIDGTRYYDATMLREVYARGHEIGCHSVEHVALGAKGPGFACASAEQNLAAMRAVLGPDFQMTSFAYPYGDVSLGVKRAMRRRFALCRGVHQGVNRGRFDAAQIRIISLESRHWDEAKLAAMIRTAQQQNAWLVFLTHDIAELPSPYGSTPAMVKTALALLAESSIPIMTLKAAAAHGVFSTT
jgi:peptidoglycan/xylan/chitin deacetylase (PgdA/CDA1 family)